MLFESGFSFQSYYLQLELETAKIYASGVL